MGLYLHPIVHLLSPQYRPLEHLLLRHCTFPTTVNLPHSYVPRVLVDS